MLGEVAKNNFTIITASQLCSDVFSIVKHTTHVGGKMMSNALIHMSVPLDSEPKHSDKQTTQAF